MYTTLEFRMPLAGLPLLFLTFMDRIAAKVGSNSFIVLFLVPFLLYVHSLTSLCGEH